MVHIQWNITQSLKNEVMPFATTWVDLEILILSEVSQTEGEILHDTPYMDSKKK